MAVFGEGHVSQDGRQREGQGVRPSVRWSWPSTRHVDRDGHTTCGVCQSQIMRFSPRYAIVTAADSGIGKATAVSLADQGLDVGITWHTDEEGARAPPPKSAPRGNALSWPAWTPQTFRAAAMSSTT